MRALVNLSDYSSSGHDDLFENHRSECNSGALEEFVLELDPVQSQSV